MLRYKAYSDTRHPSFGVETGVRADHHNSFMLPSILCILPLTTSQAFCQTLCLVKREYPVFDIRVLLFFEDHRCRSMYFDLKDRGSDLGF